MAVKPPIESKNVNANVKTPEKHRPPMNSSRPPR